MVHINDLDPEILYQILCLASGELAKDIDKWKLKLTLLQVCTAWYDLFKSYVFSQGFVDIYLMDYNGPRKVNLKSCIYFADNEIVCKSNLGIITGRDRYNCVCVSDLKFIVDFDINISQYFHVLKELLTLGVGYWFNLSSLWFFTYAYLPYSLKPEEGSLEKISATASDYIHVFQNRLPNITHLKVNVYIDVSLKTAFYILIDHYAPRLQGLHLNNPFKSPLPAFSTELTSLSLNLLNYSHQHSTFYAKSLQYLELYNISSSQLSWWNFHDFTTPGRIEFTNLKTLHLWYKTQTDKEKELSEKYSKQTRPYGSHVLRFPRLQNLCLGYPPMDCDVFYTDTMPTNLKELIIQGSFSTVAAASRLRFASVNKMIINVYQVEAPNNDFYIAADRYFGYTKIGSTCTADFNLSFDIQRTVSWVNVTEISLHIIEFNELLKHTSNFYNLRKLILYRIHLSDECFSIIRLGLEEEEQGKIELLDTRIDYLKFEDIEPDNPHSLLAFLNHFLLRIPTLKEVNINNTYSAFVENSFLPTKFLHIKFTYYQSNR